MRMIYNKTKKKIEQEVVEVEDDDRLGEKIFETCMIRRIDIVSKMIRL